MGKGDALFWGKMDSGGGGVSLNRDIGVLW